MAGGTTMCHRNGTGGGSGVSADEWSDLVSLLIGGNQSDSALLNKFVLPNKEFYSVLSRLVSLIR